MCSANNFHGVGGHRWLHPDLHDSDLAAGNIFPSPVASTSSIASWADRVESELDSPGLKLRGGDGAERLDEQTRCDAVEDPDPENYHWDELVYTPDWHSGGDRHDLQITDEERRCSSDGTGDQRSHGSFAGPSRRRSSSGSNSGMSSVSAPDNGYEAQSPDDELATGPPCPWEGEDLAQMRQAIEQQGMDFERFLRVRHEGLQLLERERRRNSEANSPGAVDGNNEMTASDIFATLRERELNRRRALGDRELYLPQDHDPDYDGGWDIPFNSHSRDGDDAGTDTLRDQYQGSSTRQWIPEHDNPSTTHSYRAGLVLDPYPWHVGEGYWQDNNHLRDDLDRGFQSKRPGYASRRSGYDSLSQDQPPIRHNDIDPNALSRELARMYLSRLRDRDRNYGQDTCSDTLESRRRPAGWTSGGSSVWERYHRTPTLTPPPERRPQQNDEPFAFNHSRPDIPAGRSRQRHLAMLQRALAIDCTRQAASPSPSRRHGGESSRRERDPNTPAARTLGDCEPSRLRRGESLDHPRQFASSSRRRHDRYLDQESHQLRHGHHGNDITPPPSDHGPLPDSPEQHPRTTRHPSAGYFASLFSSLRGGGEGDENVVSCSNGRQGVVERGQRQLNPMASSFHPGLEAHEVRQAEREAETEHVACTAVPHAAPLSHIRPEVLETGELEEAAQALPSCGGEADGKENADWDLINEVYPKGRAPLLPAQGRLSSVYQPPQPQDPDEDACSDDSWDILPRKKQQYQPSISSPTAIVQAGSSTGKEKEKVPKSSEARQEEDEDDDSFEHITREEAEEAQAQAQPGGAQAGPSEPLWTQDQIQESQRAAQGLFRRAKRAWEGKQK